MITGLGNGMSDYVLVLTDPETLDRAERDSYVTNGIKILYFVRNTTNDYITHYLTVYLRSFNKMLHKIRNEPFHCGCL